MASKPAWYYRNPDSDTTEGPLDFAEIVVALAEGKISAHTLVRTGTAGMFRPFREFNEYRDARDMPPEEVAQMVEQSNRRKSGPLGWISGLFGSRK